VNETSILDHWNQAIIRQREIESIYIVSSGAKFKHFERWASSHGIPVNHVVNNGVCDASLSRGAASDMLLGMKRSRCSLLQQRCRRYPRKQKERGKRYNKRRERKKEKLKRKEVTKGVVVGGDGGWGEVVGEEAGEVVPVRLVRENGE
jgi:hypothetical protein